MDAEILKIVGQIAGIGGIGIGVLLLLFRNVIQKNIFPQLTREHSYRLLSLIIFLTWSVAIAGIISWTYVSVSVSPSPNNTKPTKKNAEDIRLEEAIVGTWKSMSKLPMPSGFIVNLQYTFLSEGRASWRGSYGYPGNEFPLMMSGTWYIKDNTLHYKVESSNVTPVIKEGFSSATKIISITSKELTYVDPADGKTKVDPRIE